MTNKNSFTNRTKEIITGNKILILLMASIFTQSVLFTLGVFIHVALIYATQNIIELQGTYGFLKAFLAYSGLNYLLWFHWFLICVLFTFMGQMLSIEKNIVFDVCNWKSWGPLIVSHSLYWSQTGLKLILVCLSVLISSRFNWLHQNMSFLLTYVFLVFNVFLITWFIRSGIKHITFASSSYIILSFPVWFAMSCYEINTSYLMHYTCSLLMVHVVFLICAQFQWVRNKIRLAALISHRLNKARFLEMHPSLFKAKMSYQFYSSVLSQIVIQKSLLWLIYKKPQCGFEVWIYDIIFGFLILLLVKSTLDLIQSQGSFFFYTIYPNRLLSFEPILVYYIHISPFIQRMVMNKMIVNTALDKMNYGFLEKKIEVLRFYCILCTMKSDREYILSLLMSILVLVYILLVHH